MEQLINRIRAAQAVVGVGPLAIEATRQTCVASGVSEEEFFLAWHAALIADGADRLESDSDLRNTA